MTASGLGGMPALMDQIQTTRALSEHHVWQAVRMIEDLPGQLQFRRQRRLRELLEAKALIEAIIDIGAHLQPPRTPWSMARSGDRWRCQIAWCDSRDLRRCLGRHDDLAAAMMIALLNSLGRRGQRARRPGAALKDKDKTA